ncbi:MAG: hypothetical protein RQ922_03125 [Thermoproteota archaeon]|jgi:hypothetical protein|nr:hypothetical protein [Thermoproteota archaeon]
MPYGDSIGYTALLKRMHYSSFICDKVRSMLHTYPNVVGVGVSLR